MVVVLGLDDRQGDVLPVLKDVVRPLGASSVPACPLPRTTMRPAVMEYSSRICDRGLHPAFSMAGRMNWFRTSVSSKSFFDIT